jgi:hypothetical protein
MLPRVKCNKEFDKWFEQWAAVIEHSRVLSTPTKKRASAVEQEYSARERVLHPSSKTELLRRAH